MKFHIFGYGSLINPKSIEKTLFRTPKYTELIKATLLGYTRIWDLHEKVIINNADETVTDVAFLDVQKKHGKFVNGIIFEIFERELEGFDLREKNYDRIEVSNNIIPKIKNGVVYTYTGKPQFLVSKNQKPVILSEYLKVVKNGLAYWGKEFEKEFFITTEPNKYKIVEGSYRFLDKKQNLTTGHYK